MQPTLTMADIITKVINNITHALKGRRNTKGIKEIKALQKLDKVPQYVWNMCYNGNLLYLIFNKSLGLPITYAYAMLPPSVPGNLTFGGTIFAIWLPLK